MLAHILSMYRGDGMPRLRFITGVFYYGQPTAQTIAHLQPHHRRPGPGIGDHAGGVESHWHQHQSCPNGIDTGCHIAASDGSAARHASAIAGEITCLYEYMAPLTRCGAGSSPRHWRHWASSCSHCCWQVAATAVRTTMPQGLLAPMRISIPASTIRCKSR